jgi:hypothetical protein
VSGGRFQKRKRDRTTASARSGSSFRQFNSVFGSLLRYRFAAVRRGW